MPDDYILSIDQGSTGTTVLVFDHAGSVRGRAYAELTQHYPKPGWVEHDPEEILRVTIAVAAEALRDAGLTPEAVRALGITNQRETVVVWERGSGRPGGRAIVWQDRRTAARCAALSAQGLDDLVRERTGLVIDPYFSATKLAWLLDQDPGLRGRPCSARAATRRAWPRTPTAPVPSCSCTRATRRSPAASACSPASPGVSGTPPWSTPSKARSSSPAPPCNGCGTVSASSTAPRTPSPWRPRCRTTTTSTSCRHSPASAPRTGTRMPGGCSSASHAAPARGTWSARCWRAWRTRPATSSKPCSGIRGSCCRRCAATAARRRTGG